jgi:hypothetical protein
MSRLLVIALLTLPVMAKAAPLTDAQIAAQIEKARRLVAVDQQGCVKYPQNDEIVVCGEDTDDKAQRMFEDDNLRDPNRIHRGEPVSTERAAGCAYGDKLCRTPLSGGTPFGYVPPVALDYYELMKGLPEPDMVVSEGTPE